jgi:exodeoxyribonuclease VII large subunit
MQPPLTQTAEMPQREVYTVSRLNLETRGLLEAHLGMVWIEGEISNLARPRSGHIYFTLKDNHSQVRCAMFKNRAIYAQTKPQDGQQVLVQARVSLYEPRGEFQLVAEHIEPAGTGQLRREFERLKQALAAEGLFAPEHKQQLPASPGAIAVVTSPSGAAIRDVLQVLRRRAPQLKIYLFPTAVQGDNAPVEIVKAIRQADQMSACNVILVTRGGGSEEDLWAFNDVDVARTIFAASKPVVSAIGHEIDFTMADFVADLRAPTPSAAAELISPDSQAQQDRIQGFGARLARTFELQIKQEKQRLGTLSHRLSRLHPSVALQQLAQRLDEQELRLTRSLQLQISQQRNRLNLAYTALTHLDPRQAIQRSGMQLDHLTGRLQRAMNQLIQTRRLQISAQVMALDAVSPLATLSRGYAIVTAGEKNAIIYSANQVATGEIIKARLSEGQIACRVEQRLTD